MWIKIKFSVNEVMKEITNNTVDWLNSIAFDYKDEVDRLTPEDTQELLHNNTVEPVRRIWKTLVSSVYNNTEYASIVEYGITWKDYNYHKPKWTIMYTWEGNRTFARALDNIKEILIEKLSNKKYV